MFVHIVADTGLSVTDSDCLLHFGSESPSSGAVKRVLFKGVKNSFTLSEGP